MKKEKKMNKTKIAFGIGIVLTVLTVFTASAAADNVFYLVPQNSVAEPGEEIIVWVMLNASDIVTDFDARFYFDPAVLNITVFTNPESIWDWWGAGVAVDEYGTYMHAGGMDFDGGSSGVLGLANLTFKGNNTGITALNFSPRYTGCGYLGEPLPKTLINGTFTCIPREETFSKELKTGWNLVSLPLIPSNNSTSAVLGNDTIEYDAVYRYNATSKQFEDVTTGTMDPGTGYFVNVTTAGTWSYEGTPYTSMSIPLKRGLNLVGWLNCTKQISGNLSSIAGEYNYIARWNAGYEVYEPHAPEVFNDFFDMERGNGYWIAAKEDCTLTESCSG